MFKRLRKPASPPEPAASRVAVLAGQTVAYTLKRSPRRRSIGLRVDHRGLTVSMPSRAPESWLQEVLRERADWVVEKLDGWQARQPLEQLWSDGASIPFLGELLSLRVVTGVSGATVQHDGELRVALRGEADPARIEKTVTLWYRRQALSLFAERVAHFAPLLGVAPTDVKLTTARTRWGSCTARGTVRLNLQLIKLPHHLIDYVVAHELAHLIEMNHSAAFWAKVASVCPDYARCRSELKAVAL